MRYGNHRLPWLTRKALCLGAVFPLALIAGCGSNSSTSSSGSSATAGPQSYFAPSVAGATYNVVGGSSATVFTAPLTYTIDDQANIFSQTAFGFTTDGSQVLNAGDVTALQRGLYGLAVTTNYQFDASLNGGGFVPITYSGPQGSFAVELADQAGGLVQMLGQPAVPVVAAAQCPSFSSPQTYQFITIPAGLYAGSGRQFEYNWTPSAETAYGSVDIATSGSTVTFQNIQQYTLPSVGGSGAPDQPSASSVAGACGSTVYGYTTVLPGQLVITNPGAGETSNTPPQAIIGIGPSGLLVEYNGASTGSSAVMADTSPALYYDNVLGAGTGAVGLPKPSSALSTSAVVGVQYLGFVYGAGVYAGSGSPPTGWSSYTASFGFPSTLQSNCSTFAAQTGTLVNGIYGGDFPDNDPTNSAVQANGGYGNCDFAIDLGTPSDSNNSLYTQATVYLGADYAGNTTHSFYSFHAVAIAGQLNGKYALFVLGVDSAQPWAIYLLQSN